MMALADYVLLGLVVALILAFVLTESWHAAERRIRQEAQTERDDDD